MTTKDSNTCKAWNSNWHADEYLNYIQCVLVLWGDNCPNSGTNTRKLCFHSVIDSQCSLAHLLTNSFSQWVQFLGENKWPDIHSQRNQCAEGEDVDFQLNHQILSIQRTATELGVNEFEESVVHIIHTKTSNEPRWLGGIVTERRAKVIKDRRVRMRRHEDRRETRDEVGEWQGRWPMRKSGRR